MTTFVLRPIAPRPTFALDITDQERAIMAQHAAYWQPGVDAGHAVVFGPVLDDLGTSRRTVSCARPPAPGPRGDNSKKRANAQDSGTFSTPECGGCSTLTA